MRRALLDPGIIAAGVEQFGDRVFPVERHQLIAQFVGHRVQRHREVDPELGADAGDHRHHPRGRQRDLAARDRQPLRVHHDLQRRRDIVVIVERLAHPHQHDVGQLPVLLRRRPFAERVARHHDLPDDLGRAQIAHQALRAGMAEAAGQGAADLRGDAQRAAVAFRDVDGLDLLPVVEAQQPFAGAVDRDARRRDRRPAQLVVLGQSFAERLRQIGHRGEIGDAAMIDPVPQLAGAERLGPERGHFLGDLGAAQTDEIAAGHCAAGDCSVRGHGGDMGRGAAPGKLMPCRRRFLLL